MNVLLADIARSILDTVLGAFRFRGRARIVDAVYFWLATMLAGLALGLLVQPLAWDQKWFARAAIDLLLTAPMFALFARRLHDQGLSAWWTLILIPLPLVNLYQSYRAVFAVLNAEWLDQPSPVDPWLPWLMVVALAMLVVFVRPGQQGPNRYGPDPRRASSSVAVTPG